MVTHVRALIALVLTLAGLSLPVTVLRAQAGRPRVAGLRTSSHLGLGYVANIPTTFVGFSALGITPKLFGGAGVYADIKLTTKSPGDDLYYLPGVTVNDAEVTYGDMLYEEKSDWVTVNGALVYAVAWVIRRRRITASTSTPRRPAATSDSIGSRTPADRGPGSTRWAAR